MKEVIIVIIRAHFRMLKLWNFLIELLNKIFEKYNNTRRDGTTEMKPKHLRKNYCGKMFIHIGKLLTQKKYIKRLFM